MTKEVEQKAPFYEEIEKMSFWMSKELKRLKEVQQQIKDIEWNSMSPQEKKEYLEYEKMLKEKYSDD